MDSISYLVFFANGLLLANLRNIQAGQLLRPLMLLACCLSPEAGKRCYLASDRNTRLVHAAAKWWWSTVKMKPCWEERPSPAGHLVCHKKGLVSSLWWSCPKTVSCLCIWQLKLMCHAVVLWRSLLWLHLWPWRDECQWIVTPLCNRDEMMGQSCYDGSGTLARKASNKGHQYRTQTLYQTTEVNWQWKWKR